MRVNLEVAAVDMHVELMLEAPGARVCDSHSTAIFDWLIRTLTSVDDVIR